MDLIVTHTADAKQVRRFPPPERQSSSFSAAPQFFWNLFFRSKWLESLLIYRGLEIKYNLKSRLNISSEQYLNFSYMSATMQTILQKRKKKQKQHLPAFRKIKLSIHTFNHAKRDNKKKREKPFSILYIVISVLEHSCAPSGVVYINIAQLK